MPFAGPEVVVQAPQMRPAPTGLLVAAQVIDVPVPDRASAEAGLGSTGEHWIAGTRYSPESSYPPELTDPCTAGWTIPGSSTINTTALPPSASPNTRAPIRTHRPFVVEQADACSDFGATADEYRGRALRGLLAKEQTAVEDEFETPTIVPTNPGLSDGSRVVAGAGTTNASAVVTSASAATADVGRTIQGAGIPTGSTVLSVSNGVSWTLSANATATATVTVTVAVDPNISIILAGAAQSPALTLALLNEAIATADIGVGMIHATAFLVERWAQLFGLRFDASGKLTSANGNIIVAGNGYRGVGPDGTGGTIGGGATTQWAYATDLVQIRRAATPTIYPDNDREALDRNLGVITYSATRPYVIEWGGQLHAACKCNATT